MEHQETSVGKFTWKITNFFGLNYVGSISSEIFVLCGYPWRLILFTRWPKRRGVSIYLKAVQTQPDIVSKQWSRDVKFKLLLINQLNSNLTFTREYRYTFNGSNDNMGFHTLIPVVEFNDPKKGFIVKDVCIVGAEVFVYKPTHDEPVIQAANLYSSPTFGSQTGYIKVEVPRPNAEVEGPKEDSSKDADAELVSAALGRVLYFLKTRKVKDMNEQACNNLQVLWEELKKFKFDLTWLEPHVQSALGLKSYVEKSLHVEKLKKDMVLLQEKLAAAEVNLDEEIDLLKAKVFKEIDLDSELGCGSWRS